MNFDLVGCLADFFRKGVSGFLVLHGRSPYRGVGFVLVAMLIFLGGYKYGKCCN